MATCAARSVSKVLLVWILGNLELSNFFGLPLYCVIFTFSFKKRSVCMRHCITTCIVTDVHSWALSEAFPNVLSFLLLFMYVSRCFLREVQHQTQEKVFCPLMRESLNVTVPLAWDQQQVFPVLSGVDNCQHPFWFCFLSVFSFLPIFTGFIHVQSLLIGFSLFRYPAALPECSPHSACQF